MDHIQIAVADPADDRGLTALRVGRFLLFPNERALFEEEKPVRIGGRALEILIALLERPGQLISQHELMERVWPKVFVQPSNLTVQIAALRRALGTTRWRSVDRQHCWKGLCFRGTRRAQTLEYICTRL